MTRPDARRLWHAWGPGLVVAFVGVLGYLVMLDAVREQDDVWRLDEPLLEWFAAHRVSWLTDLMVLVSWIFGPVVLPILVAVGGAFWGWRTRQWFNVAIVVGAVAFAGLLSLVLKYSVGRPRPPEEFWQEPGGTHTASFPSGHTLCTATLVMVTGYMAWRTERSLRVFAWWFTASALLTATVAFSRLYLGYHFLTDVIAGAFAALFVLGLVIGVVRTHDLRDDARYAPVRKALDVNERGEVELTAQDLAESFVAISARCLGALRVEYDGVDGGTVWAGLTLVPRDGGPPVRSGKLEGIGSFAIHGRGCRFALESGSIVDVDWDEDGRAVFDSWRILKFAESIGNDAFDQASLRVAASESPDIRQVSADLFTWPDTRHDVVRGSN